MSKWMKCSNICAGSQDKLVLAFLQGGFFEDSVTSITVVTQIKQEAMMKRISWSPVILYNMQIFFMKVACLGKLLHICTKKRRISMKRKFDNVNNTLGDIIKSFRKEKNFSQEALGKLVGLGKSSISKIESGKTNISLEDASVLLEAMGENECLCRGCVSFA